MLWNNIFWYTVNVYLFLKFIQYTIYWEKTNNKRFSFRLTKCYKNKLFFLSRDQCIRVFIVVYDFCMSWSTRFITSIKVCVGFSIFDFILFLLKFLFSNSRKLWLCDFKEASTKNCESVKKCKFLMKIFFQIILNKVFNLQCWHFCKWIK